MTEVIQMQEKKRTATDAYDDLTLKIEHTKSVATLLSAADADNLSNHEVRGVGFALENMLREISERAAEVF